MIKEALSMILQFLNGNYDPLSFSYDLPDYIIEHFDDINLENEKVCFILNDNIPDICAEYERGADPREFKNAIKKEYQRIQQILNLNT